MDDFDQLERHRARSADRYYVELSFHTKITGELTHSEMMLAYPSYCQYYVDVDMAHVLLGFRDPDEAMMVRLRFT